MAPKKRLAASVVLTVAAAAPLACGESTPPVLVPNGGSASALSPSASAAAKPPEVSPGSFSIKNDGTCWVSGDKGAPARKVDCPGARIPLATQGAIQIQSDGSCLMERSYPCPPNAKCNPPGPEFVLCKQEKGTDLPLVTKGMRAHARADGTCWLDFGDVSCPPDVSCNPPAPEQVQCAPGR